MTQKTTELLPATTETETALDTASLVSSAVPGIGGAR